MATKKPILNLYAIVLNRTVMVYAPSEQLVRRVVKNELDDLGGHCITGIREISDEEAKELPKLLRYTFPLVDRSTFQTHPATEEELCLYFSATVDNITKYRLKQAKKATK